jgi:hypothetical protein
MSKRCMQEVSMARLRRRERETSLQYIDCREGDVSMVESACRRLVSEALR